MRKYYFVLLVSLFLIDRIKSQNPKPCIGQHYEQPTSPEPLITCVCNASYCDEVPPVGNLNNYEAAVYTTSLSGKRLERTIQKFDPNLAPNTLKITPNEAVVKQTIFGFGGAFTDASGLNLYQLSQNTRELLLKSYFSPDTGIGYTMGRVPMASCDFSTHNYTYDDTPGDINLTQFSLAWEDFNVKIPYIQRANDLSGGKLKLYASPWTAPFWMKTNNDDEHGGTIQGEMNGPYWQAWANYFVRFFEEYSKNNITFWGATMQNEPTFLQKFQSLLLNASTERDFAKGAWGQTLRNNPLTKNLKLMVLDHNRDHIQDYTSTVFSDKDAATFLDGLAVHWYSDAEYGRTSFYASILTWAHNNYLTNKFILYTEACNEGKPVMGSWFHGDRYFNDIINNLNNWVTGWVDWNFVLNPDGGPNWVQNFVDAPIIAFNSSYLGGDRFEKQTMFYALGHFSKFLVPDSKIIDYNIIGISSNLGNILTVSGLTPDGAKVVIIGNRGYESQNVSIINKWNVPLNLVLEQKSWTTVVYYDANATGLGSTTVKPAPSESPKSTIVLPLVYVLVIIFSLKFI